jgi:hypothetical protein
MVKYKDFDYDFLFTDPAGDLSEAAFEDLRLRHKNVTHYRTKTTYSGSTISVEIYPLLRGYDKDRARAAKANLTREAQISLNRRNATKKWVHLANHNFTESDLYITLTYGDSQPLPDEREAQRHIRNFIRRVRDYRIKHGLTAPLKYMYVIEFHDGDGRRVKVHHHLIMTGMDRDEVERIWKRGIANAVRLKPQNGSLEGLVRYMNKMPGKIKVTKKRQCSKNLIPPKVTVSNNKISKRQAERLAMDMETSAERIFTRKFSGCALDDCKVWKSDVVAGVYVHAKLYKDTGGKRDKKWNPRK